MIFRIDCNHELQHSIKQLKLVWLNYFEWLHSDNPREIKHKNWAEKRDISGTLSLKLRNKICETVRFVNNIEKTAILWNVQISNKVLQCLPLE